MGPIRKNANAESLHARYAELRRLRDYIQQLEGLSEDMARPPTAPTMSRDRKKAAEWPK